jgi:hypothetical protein
MIIMTVNSVTIKVPMNTVAGQIHIFVNFTKYKWRSLVAVNFSTLLPGNNDHQDVHAGWQVVAVATANCLAWFRNDEKHFILKLIHKGE